MNTKFLLLKEDLTFNGATVEAGEIIELPEMSAQALIDEEKAEEVEPEGGKLPDGTEDPGNDDKGDGRPNPSEGSEDDTSKQLDLTKKALNDKYTRDDLAKEAKAIEVEFAYDAKKGEIIEAVVTAGKAEVLLAK
jgi:hypothetical protein